MPSSSGATIATPRPLPSPAATPSIQSVGNGRWLIFPASARALSGTRYRIALSTHCGLDGSPIDFDGTLWDPPLDARRSPSGPVGNPVANGTIDLIGPTEALYESASGWTLPLHRHDGGKPLSGCD